VTVRLVKGLLAAGGLLGLFLVQGVAIIRYQAPTYDEARNLASAYSHWATGDFRLASVSPPLVKLLHAAPLYARHRLLFQPRDDHWRVADDYQIGQAFLYGSFLSADELLAWGRGTNLALGALLVLLTGWWAGRLWGPASGWLAMALAVVEPNLVAHASVVTTDVGPCLFMILALYLLWEHGVSPSLGRALLTGIATGLALVSKYSTIFLLPLVTATLMWHAYQASARGPSGGGRDRARLRPVLAALAAAAGPVALIVPASYLGQGYRPWLAGLRQFLTQAAAGQPAFFLGEYSTEGWWAYFPVAFLIKTPLGTLVLIAGSLLLWRVGARPSPRDAWALLAPVLAILILAVGSRVDIGLRHILPVYPFLLVLASRLATVRLGPRLLVPGLIAACLLLTVATAVADTPHQLAYFNEAVGGWRHGARYLSDSNLDWGQDLKEIRAFMAEQRLPIVYLSYFGAAPPGYYGIRYQYVPGTWPLAWPPPADSVPATAERKLLVISVFNLQEVATHDLQLFAWLRGRPPMARIGRSILVFDVGSDPQDIRRLSEAYLKVGLADMAAAEAAKVR
jgi:hypothetical protein